MARNRRFSNAGGDAWACTDPDLQHRSLDPSEMLEEPAQWTDVVLAAIY